MSDWKEVYLGEICTPKQWQTIGKSDLKEHGYPVFGANGRIGFFDTYNHKEPVIAVTCRGATCGSVTLTPPFAYVTGNSMCLDELSEEVEIKFLHQYLISSDLESVVSGSAQPQITRGDISKFLLKIPPLPEQKKIAEILSGIDKVIASKRNKIHSSELLKKALISRHVESIEDEIEEAKLCDLIHSIDSGWSPDCLKRPPLSDGEWSVLKTTSVTWKGFDQQERKALPSNLPPKKDLVVEAEDILITRAGPADRTGVVAYAEKKAINTMISDKIIRLRCDKSIIEPRFLSIFLGTDCAQRQMLKGKVGMASSQTNISQQLLREMRIRFPALEEQRRISEIVTELQKTINQIQKSIEQTEKLKQSISTDLLSGRKRVSV